MGRITGCLAGERQEQTCSVSYNCSYNMQIGEAALHLRLVQTSALDIVCLFLLLTYSATRYLSRALYLVWPYPNILCNESATPALFSFYISLSHHFLFLQAKGKKRQIGWFPATYVKVLGGSSRSTPVSMELTGREDAPPDTATTPTSAPISASTAIAQVTVTPPTDEPMKGPNDASNGERQRGRGMLREGGIYRERILVREGGQTETLRMEGKEGKY